MSSSTQRKVANLRDLVPVMRRAQGFADVIGALSSGESAAVDGAWGSSCALTAAALIDGGARKGKAAAEKHPAPDGSPGPVLLIVLPRISEVDDFVVDLSGFLPDRTLSVLPAWEALPREQSATDPVFTGRMRVLRELLPDVDAGPPSTAHAPRNKGKGAPPAQVIVTSLPALLQPVPGAEQLRRSTQTLRVGSQVDPESLLAWLVEQGFERVTAIELPGEFSMHGGILDVFPHADADPLRIEFFGDEIESIRRFDVQTQRKVADLREAGLTVVRAMGMGGVAPSPESEADRSEKSDDRNDAAAPWLESDRSASRGAPPPGPPLQRGGDGTGPLAREQATAHFLEWLPEGSWIALVELAEMQDEGR
ncbi:MAG TPA: hypothetical protein VL475_04375, partial [Planctomycetaceae bacterium]|nr:hypothetical protein [Planctomycetaceae bacterium]